MAALYSIGGAIRHHRSRAGWSQKRLAEALGISARTLSRIETRLQHPRASQLDRISKLLDVPLVDLMPPDADMPPELRQALADLCATVAAEAERRAG